MIISLPIYIEVMPRPNGEEPLYLCRPLFWPELSATHKVLSRAMNRLVEKLKPALAELGSQLRHDRLADVTFSPPLSTHELKLKIEMPDRLVRGRFLLIELERLGRRIAFTPSVPDLWFEVPRGVGLESRATDVLTRYFREEERRDGTRPESCILPGHAWVTTVDVSVSTRQVEPEDPWAKMLKLFDDTRMSGSTELRRVGRLLDALYPDELSRAVGREREVEELQRLLAAADRRPVLLVGPRLAGKTTVLHEVVFRRVAARRRQHRSRGNVWMLSPQRLISGMSFVGQWENRLQAILRTARRRDHVLYFDDLIGLFRAGVSRDSSLSAASVLKNFLQQQSVRVVSEATPAQLHAIQERDRGLADCFHVLPVPATRDEETLRILLSVQRHLENEHLCRFDLNVLPAVLELQSRYVRDAAWPGKGARFLQQLAIKRPRETVIRQHVFDEFHAQTGVSLALLDEQVELTRSHVLAELGKTLVGQPEALAVVADVAMVTRARLNDPRRPLATLLFLGPTGVGKTQCAKAVAGFLFGGERSLVRFDMNEFGGETAAARLVGTFDQPEGLLTSAIRQRPFSVILLDEIEKAHPDVFDLLLQVTGEGRLTDALGRTADFTNTLIIMTSNLGASEASRSLGFRADATTARQVYVQAAERFFRPEFFNRIDQIVPFAPLDRAEIRRIAELLIAQVFAREGLVRRRAVLDVDEQALERIVDEGYHPQLGARALQRAIQHQLAQPAAKSLNEISPEHPVVLNVRAEDRRIAVEVVPLRECTPIPESPWERWTPAERLERARAAVRRSEALSVAMRPEGPIAVGSVSPQHLRHFEWKEQVRRVRQLMDELDDASAAARRSQARRAAITPRTGKKKRIRRHAMTELGRKILLDLESLSEIHDELSTDHELASDEKGLDQAFDDLRHELAWLHAMETELPRTQRAIVLLRTPVRSARDTLEFHAQHVGNLMRAGFEYDCVEVRLDESRFGPNCRAWEVAGPHCEPLLTAEAGTHLFVEPGGTLTPIQCVWRPLTDETPVTLIVEDLLRGRASRRDARFETLAIEGGHTGDGLVGVEHVGVGPDNANVMTYAPIVRIWSAQSTIDLRSRLAVRDFPDLHALRSMTLAAMPEPPELHP